MDRWERSHLWRRRFAPPLDGAILNAEAFQLTAAQVAACFTSSVTLISQELGYVQMPLGGLIVREGSAFAAAAGNLRIESSQFSGTALLSWNPSVLTSTTLGTGYAAAYSRLATDGNVFEATGNIGGDLLFRSTVSDPTTSAGAPGSPVSIVLYFLRIPIYPQNIGGRLPLP